MSDRPNVMLLVLDTARVDGFSPYARAANTPTIGQLAARGTAFPQAIAPSSWTVPSHAAMLMGGPPRSVGICRVFGGNGTLCVPVIESQRDRYLPEVLRRNGYRTQGVSANAWISKRNGFSVGFDEFIDVDSGRVQQMTDGGWRDAVKWYGRALRARADSGAQYIEEILRSWTASGDRSPFFWFVNLLECHAPYLPPRPFNDLGPVGRLLAARDPKRYQSLPAVFEAVATGRVPPGRVLRRMRHLYDAGIAVMDHWLARILEGLDGHGLLDETVVIVTSDHGENFGESGLIGHVGSLDDRLLRVPLVMAGPGVEQAPDHVVSLDTLPQRIGDLAGIEHGWNDGNEGVAVAQFDGPVDLSDPRAESLVRLNPPPDRMRRLTQRFTCATNGSIKLVRSDGETVLYDTRSDLLEERPSAVTSTTDPDVRRLMQALDKAEAEERDATLQGPRDEDMPSELEARMRMLGYL